MCSRRPHNCKTGHFTRKNENVCEMSKNENCTWKACKTAVFHCQKCKFVTFMMPSSSWLLKPGLHDNVRGPRLPFTWSRHSSVLGHSCHEFFHLHDKNGGCRAENFRHRGQIQTGTVPKMLSCKPGLKLPNTDRSDRQCRIRDQHWERRQLPWWRFLLKLAKKLTGFERVI